MISIFYYNQYRKTAKKRGDKWDNNGTIANTGRDISQFKQYCHNIVLVVKISFLKLFVANNFTAGAHRQMFEQASRLLGCCNLPIYYNIIMY